MKLLHLGKLFWSYRDCWWPRIRLKFEKKDKKKVKLLKCKEKTGKLFNFCLHAVGVIAKKTKKEKTIE